jgi:DNA-binding transcriptional LysR family regulator
MRMFTAVMDLRSLSAAARLLGVSLPTVSRTVSALEKQLAVRLVARTTHGLTETDAGRLYYRHCRRILEEIKEAESAVQMHAKVPTGELRVTAPVTFGRYHVAPTVAEFLDRYARLSVYLLLSDHCESLSQQGLDVAIRVAALREPALSARRLGYVRRVVVGSREYFARQPVPVHPRDLRLHNCLHYTHYSRSDEWTFRERGREIRVRVHGRMRSNNQDALLDALLAGAGVAMVPAWLVGDPLLQGRLQRVLAEFEAPRTPVYAVFASHGSPPGKVRAFVEFLARRYQERSVLAAQTSGE